MAIIQISKIQARSGNLVDLPQLDEAEFGWASDTKRLFIGKTTPNENVEILTSYSEISFSQLTGSVGNLNINPVNVANGQVLAFDGTNWVNKGGEAGGLITLGDVSNLKITGGALSYVLETDGLGNLSWTPKGTIIAFIENISQADPAVVTTTEDNFLTEGAEITITDAAGMSNVNGQSYFVDILTSNTFALYTSADLDPNNTVDSTSFDPYAFTSVTDTAVDGTITVGNSAQFSVSDPVKFLGDVANTNLNNEDTYYVANVVDGTSIRVSDTISANGTPGNIVPLANVSSLTANVYVTGGRVISAVAGGGGSGSAFGSNGIVQFSTGGILDGDAGFTFDKNNNILTVLGNANVTSVNASNLVTASRFISNVATGTAPLQVTSNTLVANLYVERASFSDEVSVSEVLTGNYYPLLVDALTGNVELNANSRIIYNSDPGELTSYQLKSTDTTTVEGNAFMLANANVSGNLNVTANANIVANLNANNATINNQLTTDTLTVDADATILGNANISGDFELTGNALFSTDANVLGNLTTTDLFVANSASVDLDLTVSGNVSVTNDISANNISANSASFTDVDGNGRGLISLNASNIDTGTLSQSRLANSSLTVNGVEIALGESNVITANTTESLTPGDYIVGSVFDGGTARTWDIDATSLSTAEKVVARDADGSFSANVVTANLLTGTLTTTSQPNITSVGTLTSLNVFGNISTTGNLSATNINGGNLVSANFFAGTLTTASQPNITSVGTLTSLSVTGNVNANNISANTVTGTTLTGSLTTASQPNITSVGTLSSLSVTGNLSAGNVSGGNLVSANFLQGDGSLITNLAIPGGTSITNGNSQVVVDLNGEARFTIAGVSNVLRVTSTGAILSGNLSVTNISGSGTALSALNASNLTSGTVSSARLSGAYDITANTANRLTTGRSINGTTFDGTQNITTANWGTARNITIGARTRSVNGSTDLTWSLADIGAQPAGSYLTSVNLGRTEGTTSVTITNTGGTDVTIRDATTGRAGLVTTGNQTWNGTKTSTNFVATSDANLKDNIESLDAGECLEKILALRPTSYNWKDSGEYDTGLIAQEVKEVIPHKVHTTEEGTLALAYSKLVAELIGAVQAQNKAIELLKEEIKELKGRN